MESFYNFPLKSLKCTLYGNSLILLRAAISVNRILLSVSIQVKVLLVFSQSFAKITIDISDVGEDINQTPLNISEHLLIKKNKKCCVLFKLHGAALFNRVEGRNLI